MKRDALCVTRRALDLKDLGALAVFVDLDSYLTEELNHAGWKAQLKSRDHSASLIEMQALLGIEGHDEAQSALQPHLCCRLWFFRLGLERHRSLSRPQPLGSSRLCAQLPQLST